jgi:hypothetical protein
MEYAKKILMGFGGFFVLIILAIIFLGKSSSEFSEHYKPFAKQFIIDFSTDWDDGKVFGRMSNSFKEQAMSEHGKQIVLQFKDNLGSLRSISSIELEHYKARTGGEEEARFSVSAEYEKGHAVWQMSIIVSDSSAKVEGVNLSVFKPNLQLIDVQPTKV